jgi:hypothetical protein
MTSRRRRLDRTDAPVVALRPQGDKAFRYSAQYKAAEISQLNDRDIALRRIELRRSFAMKVVNARRMPPRKDSVDGRSNRNPVSRPSGLAAACD